MVGRSSASHPPREPSATAAKKVCLGRFVFVRKNVVSKSAALPGRLNRVIRPLCALLAGRGPRGAEPVRLLAVALYFLFLFWKLRRLAGMAGNSRVVRPRARGPLAIKTAAEAGSETGMHERSPAASATQADPGMPDPNIGQPPGQEASPVYNVTEKMPPYGAHLLRLLQQPEIRALLEASPQLKPSLRRLLRLLGSEIPPELAVAQRPSFLSEPRQPRLLSRAGAAPEQSGPGRWRPQKANLQSEPRRALWSLDRGFVKKPPWRSKGASFRPQTRVHFVTIK